MGLGKTVMVLGLILSNPAPPSFLAKVCCIKYFECVIQCIIVIVTDDNASAWICLYRSVSHSVGKDVH